MADETTLLPPSKGNVPGDLPCIPGYRIVGILGRGGMGIVYLAQDERLGRDVALKLLPVARADDPQALARFEREARLASSLNHPHICTVYTLGEYSGQPFLVLELVRGRTLFAFAAEEPPLVQRLRVGAQIAEALAAAHRAGIIHRDIKPGNVM